jgi:hypothetical protein
MSALVLDEHERSEVLEMRCMSDVFDATADDDGIRFTCRFPASAERVFAAWASPEDFARWFGGPQVAAPSTGCRGTRDQAEAGLRSWCCPTAPRFPGLDRSLT